MATKKKSGNGVEAQEGRGAQEARGAPDSAERSAEKNAQQDTDAAEQEDVSLEELSELGPEEQAQVLVALARLDLEAAEAYKVCAELVDEDGVREVLTGFMHDHLRHVDDLNALIERRGGKVVPREEPKVSLLGPLAETAASLGDDVTVMALLGNEQLTNRSYEIALEIEWDDEARRVIERNVEDERRHLAWLDEVEDNLLRDLDETEGERAGVSAPAE